MAGKKILVQDRTNARQTEYVTKDVSTGAANVGDIPALNANGFLDSTIVNSTVTGGTAGQAGKVLALDANGRIDNGVLPVGIGADTAPIVTSEALAAGAYVNIFSSTGAKARNADATVAGKEAHGFVIAAFASGATATVYFEGTNTAVATQTPGVVYLSTTAGVGAATPPTAAGNVQQVIGFAYSATNVNFQSEPPTVLA